MPHVLPPRANLGQARAGALAQIDEQKHLVQGAVAAVAGAKRLTQLRDVVQRMQVKHRAAPSQGTGSGSGQASAIGQQPADQTGWPGKAGRSGP